MFSINYYDHMLLSSGVIIENEVVGYGKQLAITLQ